jgi:hypothetical protein
VHVIHPPSISGWPASRSSALPPLGATCWPRIRRP